MMAAATQDLLVELFVEELPPKALRKLGEAFASTLADSLKAQGLADAASAVTPYASPRRLAARITAVRDRAADRAVSHKLMPVAVGLDAQGAPTAALLKKLAALGEDADAAARLARRVDGKAELLFLDSTAAGATLAAGLQKALDEAIAKLPIPKVMRYQLADGWTSVDFVRPAHGLLALHGADVVPVRALGLEAGRETHGHRFEAARDPVVLDDADDYVARLRDDGAVIAGFAERRAEIVRQLAAAAAAAGEALVVIDDDALLDEVTALVERPNVLTCRFDEEFLDVPAECLILTMKANQKYFPLLDADGRLTSRFLVVSNISPADPSRVVEGNERVVRPRLADAKFFFEQDRKKSLAARVPRLDEVVYHNKLGSQGERVARVRAIARGIGERLGGAALAAQADQAAQLAKADLLTDMVGEFPELQGVMGRYYAQAEGLDDDVAWAIEEHYKPRFAGDSLPRSATGTVVALADKLETLVGLFSIGQLPTGDKDPFALRRHALGIVRLLMENAIELPVRLLAEQAAESFAQPDEARRQTVDKVVGFVWDRLGQRLRDQGASAAEVDAVTFRPGASLHETARVLDAVRAFESLPEAASLAAANKRVKNILDKSGGMQAAAATGIEPGRLVEPAERELHAALGRVAGLTQALHAAGSHTEALQALAALKAPVDAFFDGVMVNAEDPALRANRLALLARLHAAMNRVADLSKLAA